MQLIRQENQASRQEVSPPAGGAAGREEGIIVSADTSDILGGSDEPFTARPRSSSGVQYGSVKVSWTYQPDTPE